MPCLNQTGPAITVANSPIQGSVPMSFSMSQASLPVFEIGLNALSGVLDKAEAYAAAKKIDSSVLLNSRLSQDMFTLARQVQVAADQAKNGSARLAGVEAPHYEDSETTMDQLKARLVKTVAYLKTLDPKQIDASADREITFPLGPTNKGHMKGDNCLNHFVLPNFYFPDAYWSLRSGSPEASSPPGSRARGRRAGARSPAF